jgi:hypothetical protein
MSPTCYRNIPGNNCRRACTGSDKDSSNSPSAIDGILAATHIEAEKDRLVGMRMRRGRLPADWVAALSSIGDCFWRQSSGWPFLLTAAWMMKLDEDLIAFERWAADKPGVGNPVSGRPPTGSAWQARSGKLGPGIEQPLYIEIGRNWLHCKKMSYQTPV